MNVLYTRSQSSVPASLTEVEACAHVKILACKSMTYCLSCKLLHRVLVCVTQHVYCAVPA